MRSAWTIKDFLCKLLEISGSYSISYCISVVEAANDVQVDTACGKGVYQIWYCDRATYITKLLHTCNETIREHTILFIQQTKHLPKATAWRIRETVMQYVQWLNCKIRARGTLSPPFPFPLPPLSFFFTPASDSLSPSLPLSPLTSRPLKSSQGVWGSAVSSPSGVWGGAPAEMEFGAF